MSDLVACYFCGAALDDPLSSVHLDGTRLTLCRGCREKLDRVLDAVNGGSMTTGSESTTDSHRTDRQSGDPSSDMHSDNAEPTDGDDTDPESSPSTTEGDTDQPTSSADDQRSVVEGDQEVSALEYNKVMRMLKNRDFPIDRDEFVAVAANAYQISHMDCDRVIDAAIEQGLLKEDDGQLERPD